jgi:hypothetical protein
LATTHASASASNCASYRPGSGARGARGRAPLWLKSGPARRHPGLPQKGSIEGEQLDQCGRLRSRAKAVPSVHARVLSDLTQKLGQNPLVSRGFVVYNLSSHPIKLIKVTGDNNFEGRTPDGSILEAKSAWHRFEVQARFTTTQRNTAHYAILGDNGQQIGTFDVHMVVEFPFLPPIIGQSARCETSIGTCTISPSQDAITLFDPAGPLGLARTSTAPAAGRAALVSAGFLIYNLSSHPIKLIKVTGDNNFEGRTPDGSILDAKSAWHRFEVQVRFGKVQRNTAHYAILGDNGQQIGTFDPHMEAEVNGHDSSCTTSIGACNVSPAFDVITLFDPGRAP